MNYFSICFLSLLVLFLNEAVGINVSVLEYFPILPPHQNAKTVEEATTIQLTNLDEISNLISADKTSKVLVTPEYGLYGASINKWETMSLYCMPMAIHSTPFKDPQAHPVLQRASELAVDHNRHIVFNMCEKEEDKQYSTLVMFDKTGKLIEKYHKTHLYREDQIFTPGSGVPKFVDIDGIRYGLLICFDIMFSKPLHQLVHEHHIDVLLFSSFWVNFSPLITGLPTQQAASLFYGIPILSSNSGFSYRTSGSSIIDHSGVALSTTFNPSLSIQNHLIQANLPLEKHHSRVSTTLPTRLSTARERQLVNKVILLSTKSVQFHDTVSIDSSVSCHFDVDVSHNVDSNPVYLTVFAMSGQSLGLRSGFVCGLFYCGSNATFCSEELDMRKTSILDSPLSFSKLNVKGSMHSSSSSFISHYPLVSGSQSKLFNPLSQFSYNASSFSSSSFQFDFSLRESLPLLSTTFVVLDE
mmetsp:Transcript_82/g.141  ORF Transcript_82/g.141 Transcript_82/m.141 type:complete len:469 (+) Transcript_82:20-1426(+)